AIHRGPTLPSTHTGGRSMRATRWLLGIGLLALAHPVLASTIVVRPGHSIQAAVDQASPGDTVAVLPGKYREAGRPCPTEPETCAVVVTQDNISLVGPGRVVLKD